MYGSFWFAPILHGITTTWARIAPSTEIRSLLLKTGVDMTTSFPVNVSMMIACQNQFREAPSGIFEYIYIRLCIAQNLLPALIDLTVLALVSHCSHTLLTLLLLTGVEKLSHYDAVAQNLWPSVKAGWCFWPWYGMLMYSVVPLHYRVLFLNAGSFFWNGFLGWRFQGVKGEGPKESE